MKYKLLIAFVVASLSLSSQRGLAGVGDAKAELNDLVAKIQVKFKAGQKTEADLADELKQFDDLLAEHKAEKTDDVAQILLLKAALYTEVFNDPKKGAELMDQLKRDFPDCAQVAMLKKQEEGKKIQSVLVAGSKFPDFDVKDVAGKPLSVANYKGKVVLIDFWATWCGPCVAELPNVLTAYEKYHSKGFDIIGISLDEDKTKLTTFTNQKKMTWQQFFDGQGWKNQLAVKYGVNAIPATYLLDGEGKIIAKDLRGEALDQALAKALAAK